MPATKLKEPNTLSPLLNKIHKGDCISLMDSMPSESIGAVITSPPYNLKNSTGNGMRDGRGGKWSNAALINGYSDHHGVCYV